MQRMNTEMLKKKSSLVTLSLAERVVRARDAAEEGAARIGPGLRPHQRDAHRGSGGLVLADRDPGATEPRVPQPQRAEHGDDEQQDREPVEEVGRRDLVLEELRVAAGEEARGQEPAGDVREVVAEAGLVDRVDPERAVREVEPADVVAVPRDLGQDLAEPERDDREVVAAEPQRREADQDPEERGDRLRRSGARGRSRGGCRRCRPGCRPLRRRCSASARAATGQLSTEKWGLLHFSPWNCPDANQPIDVRPDRVEGDVAEVEQARVADDDVQSDGHHHEDHHVSAGARGHVRERAERPGSRRGAPRRTGRRARRARSRAGSPSAASLPGSR